MDVVRWRWPGPGGGIRQDVHEIERVHDRLTHIGIWMARQRSRPSFDGVHCCADGRETAAIENALKRGQLCVCLLLVAIGDNQRRCHVADDDIVGAESL